LFAFSIFKISAACTYPEAVALVQCLAATYLGLSMTLTERNMLETFGGKLTLKFNDDTLNKKKIRGKQL